MIIDSSFLALATVFSSATLLKLLLLHTADVVALDLVCTVLFGGHCKC
jgi:hypothetical protein